MPLVRIFDEFKFEKMNIKYFVFLCLCLCFVACEKQHKTAQVVEKKTVIRPILLDAAYLSGLNLKSVTNANQPDRKLFQKRLYRGTDISIYIVSSESASANHESYGMEEFLYLINGAARMKPKQGAERYYYTGDFFIAPKGYIGEWETIGATDFHHELSVISTKRNKKEANPDKLLPVLIDKKILSGIGMTKINTAETLYRDTIYQGHELTIITEAEAASNKTIDQALDEQLIYVIAGAVNIIDKANQSQTFYAGDFFVLPANFTGQWKSSGHQLFRSMRISKSK